MATEKKNFLIASVVEPADDEEPEDVKPIIEEKCKESAECSPVKAKYDTCAERVLGGQSEDKEETCVEVWP